MVVVCVLLRYQRKHNQSTFTPPSASGASNITASTAAARKDKELNLYEIPVYKTPKDNNNKPTRVPQDYEVPHVYEVPFDDDVL